METRLRMIPSKLFTFSEKVILLEKRYFPSRKGNNVSTPSLHSSVRVKLLKKRLELEGKLRADLQRRDEEDGVKDTVESAFLSAEKDLNAALITMAASELVLINDALDRIQNGTYHVCLDCGEEIEKKRIEALPFATLCRSCKESSEELEVLSAKKKRQAPPLFHWV